MELYYEDDFPYKNVHAVSKAWTKGGHETYLEIIKINIL